MTEQAQTTYEWAYAIISARSEGEDDCREAAEIFTEKIDALRAEVARIRLPAEAWEAREALVAASKIRDAALWEIGAPNTDRYRVTKSAWLVAEEAAEAAAARAREAKA